MLRYEPPKSSVWGHSLRKMPEDRIKSRFSQFLTNAVAAYDELWPVSARSQTFEIKKWRINGQEVDTRSRIMIHFGERPYISTMLVFETFEQFQSIKRVLEDIGLCKLNEKHLKMIKTKSKRLPE